MLRPKTLLPIVATSLIVFVCSTQSQAGCAWIFWHKIEVGSLTQSSKNITDGWQASQALDDKKQCVALLQSSVKARASEWQKPRPDGPRTQTDVGLSDTSGKVVQLVHADNGDINFITDEYLCMPDTVDPRGKK